MLLLAKMNSLYAFSLKKKTKKFINTLFFKAIFQLWSWTGVEKYETRSVEMFFQDVMLNI